MWNDLERVMNVKKVKKPGQYFLERHVISGDDKDKTVRKTNAKTLVFMAGKCPTCGNAFFSDYDPTSEAKIMDCASGDKCSTKFMFIEGALRYETNSVQSPAQAEDQKTLGHQSQDEGSSERQVVQP